MMEAPRLKNKEEENNQSPIGTKKNVDLLQRRLFKEQLRDLLEAPVNGILPSE
jgi:hypothetical protein